MIACSDCGKTFDQRSSMEQHFSAKHAKKQKPVRAKKTVKPIVAVAGVVALILLVSTYFVFFNENDEENKGYDDLTIIEDGEYSVNLDEVPKGVIHWHPVVTITIKGKKITIPLIGSSGSSHGPGIYHKPIHTHDTSGTLHLEMSKPTAETMVLGYFFDNVWKKTFNNTCISDLRDPGTKEIFCNGPEGNLTMMVNGKPNYQFDRYIPKDREDIRIVFE